MGPIFAHTLWSVHKLVALDCPGIRCGGFWQKDQVSGISSNNCSLSYRLCFEYFSQFKIDSEMYIYFAAVLNMVMYQDRSSLQFGNYFVQNNVCPT